MEELVPTHGHLDHMGFAARPAGVGRAVPAHADDMAIVASPSRDPHERARLPHAIATPASRGPS